MADAQSAIDHLNRLVRLAERLSARGIALYEHDYVTLAFGSFRLEIGTRHKRWGLWWDGKDGCLTISAPYAPRDGRRAPLVAGQVVSLGLGDPDQPFSYIEQLELARD